MKVTLNRKCNTWVYSRCKLFVRLLKRHTTSLSLIVQPSLTTTMCAFGQFFWFLGPTFAYTVEDLLKLQFDRFFFFFFISLESLCSLLSKDTKYESFGVVVIKLYKWEVGLFKLKFSNVDFCPFCPNNFWKFKEDQMKPFEPWCRETHVFS